MTITSFVSSVLVAHEVAPSPPGFAATSLTSMTIGTGIKPFATQSGRAYKPGARVRLVSAADPTDYMEGDITAYAGTAMTVNVTRIGPTSAGTAADWSIVVAGDPGSGDLLSALNLSDIEDKAEARDNLEITQENLGIADSVFMAAVRSDLKAADTSRYQTAYLIENGRSGIFVWRSGNYAAQVAADTQEGVYVKATAVAASVGAWERGATKGEYEAIWFGVKGDGTTNDTPAIQAAIDFVYATVGGGIVKIPAGVCNTTATVTIKGGVRLIGAGKSVSYISGFGTNVLTLSFGPTCIRGCAIEDLTVQGYYNANSALVTNNAVFVEENIPAYIMNCRVWYGAAALFTKGVDGTYFNSWFIGCIDAVVSNGANWYERCILDTNGSFGAYRYAFSQGTKFSAASSQENHFTDCDFSGPFTESVHISGSNTVTPYTVTSFENCVFSSPMSIQAAYWTSFVGCEFGSSSFTLNGAPGGTVSVVGCAGIGTTVVMSGAFSKAGNFNIS
ncbi:glycosyl hydrolase family 28-related protein [Tardiphaga sp. 11_C7_N12_6]|uniref:glycosyl hydrolase family 28-related protein n=1 Tax=Tardiphaga sp. 11_C7_N12_6 TaxID=3240789 RepID=UPI003F216B0E